MWLLLLYVMIAGAIGGIVNSLIADRGLSLPSLEKVGEVTIVRLGWMGNVIVGAAAAAISWGLYGPMAAFHIAGMPEALSRNPSPEGVGLTLASLVGAALVGMGGARWLTNEVDKSLLRQAASQAAGATASNTFATKIAVAAPAEALHIARSMPR